MRQVFLLRMHNHHCKSCTCEDFLKRNDCRRTVYVACGSGFVQMAALSCRLLGNRLSADMKRLSFMTTRLLGLLDLYGCGLLVFVDWISTIVHHELARDEKGYSS